MIADTIYRYAYDELSSSYCSLLKFRTIKDTYKNEIDSERIFERIANIANLLKILEKRDCLSAYVLKHISTELNREDIITAIDTGRISQRYSVQIPTPEATNKSCKVLPEVALDPDCRVFDVISSQIGKKWKDFARALGIGEGYIDELQAAYSDRTSEIIREVLKYHKSVSDQNYWKVYLYDALNKARRRDLSEYVQRLYATYGM